MYATTNYVSLCYHRHCLYYVLYNEIFLLFSSVHRSDRLLPLGCDILLLGDSIVRYCTFDTINLTSKTLCYPGATVNSLRTSLRNSYENSYDTSLKFVIIHVGTNNLNNSFWEKDCKDYINLFNTVREFFRSATVVFSGILPRWDVQDLFESSVVYNKNIEQLSRKLPNCLFCDAGKYFVEDDILFCDDGLHLNCTGSIQLSLYFESFIHEELSRCQIPSQKRVWIPPELKKLYAPKKKKKRNSQSGKVRI